MSNIRKPTCYAVEKKNTFYPRNNFALFFNHNRVVVKLLFDRQVWETGELFKKIYRTHPSQRWKNVATIHEHLLQLTFGIKFFINASNRHTFG